MAISQGQVSVTDLAKATGVSEVTTRQDLNTLERLSYLRHMHGFAVSFDSDDVETRMISNYMLGHELAEFAMSLVQPGETIPVENGSSNALLVRALGEQKKNATIITVSSYTAHLLKGTPCEVILLSGMYQKKSESIVGPLTHQYIQQVHFSKALIGIDGWQPETGFTGRDMVRVDVANVVPEKEYEAVVLTDNSKLDAVHLYSIGPVKRFNHVITDSKIRADDLMYLKHNKLTAHVADIWPFPLSTDDLQFDKSSALR